MISVELCVVGGKHAGQSISLTKKKFLIGREQDCQLRPNSELVSRHHCVFTVDDFAVRLRDLGSTNGTSVNGERIRKETVLSAGDRVIVGNLEFEIKVNSASAAPAPQETTAPPTEDTIVSGTDTLTEMPALGGTAESTGPEEETFIREAPVEESAAAPAAAADSVVVPPQPETGTGDTTVIAQPMMMPPQQMGQTPQMGHPQQMMPPQQMGYPQQMYGQYPYQGMPGQMPMYPPQGYPQQQPMYPQQQQPQMQPPAPQAEPPAAEAAAPDMIDVSLPDPANTGATDDPPPAPAPAADGAAAPAEVKSNQSAAEIIKNQMNRRPGG
ncbi:MAG: FHA domain-containing protein [Fuerstiella sp.]